MKLNLLRIRKNEVLNSLILRNFMVNLENEIKAIIIPTCDYFENINRAKTAIEFSKKNNLPKKCVIAGLGPDKNLKLGYDMYNYLMNETDWMIGIENSSANSIENILNVFPNDTEGKYALVSYPLHLMRFKKIIKDAKKYGKIPKDIDIVYVPTKQNIGWVIYEILSNIKYHLNGKQKYFGK
jgi:hypothetical protein